MAQSHRSMAQRRSPNDRRSVGAGVLLGIAVMAAIDEIVFHQILAWHHFYDRATPRIALLSDGLLHAAELVMLVGGIFLILDLSRRQTLVIGSAWGGLLLGGGAFQLFDGIVNHKILRLHQVRYDADLLPYDLAWNIVGAVLLLIGVIVTVQSGRSRRADVGHPGHQ